MPPRPAGRSRRRLPYLDDADDRAAGALAIQLEVTLTTAKMRDAGLAPHVLSRGSADAAMYWSAAQIVTHHSANGCNLQPGDLIGTGTLSTDSGSGLGSLMEISQGGKAPLDARQRRNPQLPRRRRRNRHARLVRRRGRGADRLRRMRRPGGSGAVSLGGVVGPLIVPDHVDERLRALRGQHDK